MLLAPDLTKTERDELIQRCPEANRWAFAGWLNHTHELDGSLIEQNPVTAEVVPR